jgi:hypothetical protein
MSLIALSKKQLHGREHRNQKGPLLSDPCRLK